MIGWLVNRASCAVRSNSQTRLQLGVEEEEEEEDRMRGALQVGAITIEQLKLRGEGTACYRFVFSLPVCYSGMSYAYRYPVR